MGTVWIAKEMFCGDIVEILGVYSTEEKALERIEQEEDFYDECDCPEFIAEEFLIE